MSDPTDMHKNDLPDKLGSFIQRGHSYSAKPFLIPESSHTEESRLNVRLPHHN